MKLSLLDPSSQGYLDDILLIDNVRTVSATQITGRRCWDDRRRRLLRWQGGAT
ncbi:hypothetical protein [Wolbachia endosymbiont (group A) of Anomoia purmunda]|uniref:hypothetical protein n=1 Tax=Wolbachia endosymbiont (group A) of Anomoia purmunda TaxID=2953978 RepID=UPI0022316095|nr:hypothetical protein [Wolbachia endosymbiont (group A) of Anomoia purmunda]